MQRQLLQDPAVPALYNSGRNADVGSGNDWRRGALRKIVAARLDRPVTGGPSVPQDIVHRLDFTFYTDLVGAPLKALGL